jgi:hypothetical protein
MNPNETVSGDALQPEVEMFIAWMMGEWNADVMTIENGLAEILLSMRREFWGAYKQRPGVDK